MPGDIYTKMAKSPNCCIDIFDLKVSKDTYSIQAYPSMNMSSIIITKKR